MENCCRTCLKNSLDMELFISEDLIYKIKLLSSIEIDAMDTLPKKVCEKCILRVNDYYSFREDIIKSDKLLRENVSIKAEPEDNSMVSEYMETEDFYSNNPKPIQDKYSNNPNISKFSQVIEPENDQLELETSSSPNDLESFAEMSNIKIEEEYVEHVSSTDLSSLIEAKDETLLKFCVPQSSIQSVQDSGKQSPKITPVLVNCEICNKAVGKKGLNSHMRSHMRSHKVEPNLEDKFVCRCGYETKVAEEWVEHKKNQAHLRDCPYCPLKPGRPLLMSHVKTHLSKEESSQGYMLCEICVFKTTDKQELADHRENHQPLTSCKICGIVGSRNFIYNKHSRTHKKKPVVEVVVDGEKMYVCPKCDFKCQDEGEYKKHKTTHVIRVVCNICGASVTRYNFKCHLLKHTGGKVKCDICSETVGFNSFKSHKMRHTVEDNTCEICGEKFTIKSLFMSHKVKHRERYTRRDKGCSYCDKKFKDKKTLEQHIRTHTGERPFPCTICKKQFSSAHSLKTHQRQHTKECPYVCQICSMAFPQKVTLRRHLKSKHNATLLQDNTILKDDENEETKE